MPAYPRRAIVATAEVGVYHCVARCVRRAFLCGKDAVTGRSFEHRKEWIRKRLEKLAGAFGIDVCGYTVMSNHLHVVLRIRPDLVQDWPEEEVAARWWKVFPQRFDVKGYPVEPEPEDLQAIIQNSAKQAERRKRLASLSWFMRCLCEPIARQANREDDCTGRFWEGRFRSQALLDDAAILACSVYVDLNPVRAGVAKTPEESEYTSARDRIESWHLRQHGIKPTGGKRVGERRSLDRKSAGKLTPAAALSAEAPDGWLCELTLDDGPSVHVSDAAMTSNAEP